jgi:hypothetical protein
MLDAVSLELVAVGCAKDFVASYLGGDDLANDIFVGEANDEAVFGSVVFVLGLSDKTLARIVIGFTCTATLVLGLVAAAIALVGECGAM